MMKPNPIPEDADVLLAIAENIAAVLSEKRDELGISTDVEALLRVSIAGARFAINRYLAVAAGAKKSSVAMSHLAAARSGCDRWIRQLRRRVARSIAQLCRYMDRNNLLKAANYALSISA